MTYVRFDGNTGKILSSSPRSGWSICKTGTGAYTVIYKKPSLYRRILDFILNS